MIFKTIEEASAMAEELRKDGYTVSIKERDEGITLATPFGRAKKKINIT